MYVAMNLTDVFFVSLTSCVVLEVFLLLCAPLCVEIPLRCCRIITTEQFSYECNQLPTNFNLQNEQILRWIPMNHGLIHILYSMVMIYKQGKT